MAAPARLVRAVDTDGDLTTVYLRPVTSRDVTHWADDVTPWSDGDAAWWGDPGRRQAAEAPQTADSTGDPCPDRDTPPGWDDAGSSSDVAPASSAVGGDRCPDRDTPPGWDDAGSPSDVAPVSSAVGGDEVDAVHPRLTSGRPRRCRPPAFLCDTCCRDTTGWQDCADHAYRSGHGLAARCRLCRLPAVRCRRRGRPGTWHRCPVVDTVRQLGAANLAALLAGSHLTVPHPWRLACGQCGAAFAAKTARLVRHLVEEAHAVRRHCALCLFPVFGFGLSGERRELHVCVGGADWLRPEEGALLAAGDSGPPPPGRAGRRRSDDTCPPPAADGWRLRRRGSGAARGEDVTSDCGHLRHRRPTSTSQLDSRTGHDASNERDHSSRNSCDGVLTPAADDEAQRNGGISSNARHVEEVTGGDGRWSQDWTPSCVAT